MIRFKNHNPGISFIEVMVALVMVSLVIVASFKTQGVLLRTTVANARELEAVAAIKNYYMQATQEKFLEKEGKQEKHISFPALDLTYQATRAKDASAFKNISDIMIEKVTARWDEFNQERTLTLVRFTYKKPEEKVGQ